MVHAWSGGQPPKPLSLPPEIHSSDIRFPLPDPGLAVSLPAALAGHVSPDGRALVIRDADVTAALRDLMGWADAHRLDLTGIEVGPPSLEEAYLAATGGSLALETSSHA